MMDELTLNGKCATTQRDTRVESVTFSSAVYACGVMDRKAGVGRRGEETLGRRGVWKFLKEVSCQGQGGTRCGIRSFSRFC